MLARSTRRGPLHALSRAQGRPVRRHHRRGLRGRAPLADARRPHRLAAAGLPARHPLALARYRRRGQDRGARRIDLLVCAADAADFLVLPALLRHGVGFWSALLACCALTFALYLLTVWG